MTRITLPSIASIPHVRRLTLATLALVCAGSIANAAQTNAPPNAAHLDQAQSAPAQPNQGPPPGVPPGTPETISPAEFNRMFEAYALLQAQNQLKLTDDQYADFIVRLRGLQNARRRHQQSRVRLIQDLRRLTAPQNANFDEGAIRTTLDALSREDTTAHEEITKAVAQVDEVLDVRQRARFRVLEEQLERWKLDLLSRVRRPGAGAGSRPGAKVRPPKS
jgi:Spy/CpxP family protein refolding chaperone